MGASPRVHLYCEDTGHENFVRALVERMADECGTRALIETVSGRGGHGRAIAELRGWQRRARAGGVLVPDLLVVVIDGNCAGWSEARRTVLEEIDGELFPRSVVGCPDPHIERWCIADPESFVEVIGRPPLPDPGKCERGVYKRLLRESIEASGQPIITNEMEFATELAAAMDLYRASKRLPALGHFVRELRAVFQALL